MYLTGANYCKVLHYFLLPVNNNLIYPPLTFCLVHFLKFISSFANIKTTTFFKKTAALYLIRDLNSPICAWGRHEFFPVFIFYRGSSRVLLLGPTSLRCILISAPSELIKSATHTVLCLKISTVCGLLAFSIMSWNIFSPPLPLFLPPPINKLPVLWRVLEDSKAGSVKGFPLLLSWEFFFF